MYSFSRGYASERALQAWRLINSECFTREHIIDVAARHFVGTANNYFARCRLFRIYSRKGPYDDHRVSRKARRSSLRELNHMPADASILEGNTDAFATSQQSSRQ